MYIDFRVNLSKNKWNPYISASVGYRFSSGNVNLSEHGIVDNIKPNFDCSILSVAYGVSKPVNDRCALFFSVALERTLDNKIYELSTSCNGKSEYVDNISVSYTNSYYLAPTLSIGLSF